MSAYLQSSAQAHIHCHDSSVLLAENIRLFLAKEPRHQPHNQIAERMMLQDQNKIMVNRATNITQLRKTKRLYTGVFDDINGLKHGKATLYFPNIRKSECFEVKDVPDCATIIKRVDM